MGRFENKRVTGKSRLGTDGEGGGEGSQGEEGVEGASLKVEPVLYAQLEVLGQRHSLGADANHNICCLGRCKRLPSGNGKLLFVTSKPTITRSITLLSEVSSYFLLFLDNFALSPGMIYSIF